MKRILSAIAMLMFFTTGTAGASMTLASWDMYGEPGNQAFTEGISSEFVTAENMVRGDGLSVNSGPSWPTWGENSLNSKGWGETTDHGDYLEFGLTMASGYQALLNQLWIGTKSSNTGPGTIGVYTSLDNYTSPIFTITQTNDDYTDSIIDLSVLGPVTGTLYVRLIEIGNTQADGSGGTAGGGTFRIADYSPDNGVSYTDVQITGDVSAVPLPAAAWLLGSGLVGLLGIRRRG